MVLRTQLTKETTPANSLLNRKKEKKIEELVETHERYFIFYLL